MSKIYLKTLGSFCGEVILTCLFTFILPKTTSISFTFTPNWVAKNFTRWSVALPFTGAHATDILS